MVIILVSGIHDKKVFFKSTLPVNLSVYFFGL